MKIAILGANGFIATRSVELWHSGPNELRPIVRRYPALARLSRFDLDCRVVEAADGDELSKNLAGCDVVVDCVTGDGDTILESAIATYGAANRAGVRRIVYLSSASVHGQNPAVGTDESSPLSDRQWHWYNNAKVRAEAALRRLRKTGSTEIAILRPGIVWGPRSRWISNFVENLMNGTACVPEGGTGTLNSVFVDNLVHAIALCLDSPSADGESFLVQDDEERCWRDLYEPLCLAAGRDWTEVVDLPRDTEPEQIARSRVQRVKSLAVTQVVAPRIGARPKRMARALLGAWERPSQPDAYALPQPRRATIAEDTLRLQTCGWRLPDTKARRALGYGAVESFDKGMVMTVDWLNWAGYPVEASRLAGG